MWEFCRVGNAASSPDAKDTYKDFTTRGATWGSRPPMFVLGVSMAVGESKVGDHGRSVSMPAGADRFGMRVAMDVE